MHTASVQGSVKACILMPILKTMGRVTRLFSVGNYQLQHDIHTECSLPRSGVRNFCNLLARFHSAVLIWPWMAPVWLQVQILSGYYELDLDLGRFLCLLKLPWECHLWRWLTTSLTSHMKADSRGGGHSQERWWALGRGALKMSSQQEKDRQERRNRRKRVEWQEIAEPWS